MKDKLIFLPGLNGLRAIAAIAVVISHTTLAMKSFALDWSPFGITSSGTPKGYLLASYGVTIFFVLSGFLITYLLMLEKEIKEINVRSFYFRRIFRIWPLYYLYLGLVLFVIIVINKQNVNLNSLIYYIFFTANIPFIFNFALPYLDHLWSIGVEEQFYFFWPWLIKKINNIIPFVIVLIIIFNLSRIMIWILFPKSYLAIFSIVNRFDCMMIGGIAGMLFYKKNIFFLNFFDNKMTQYLALIILLLLVLNKFHTNAIIDTFIISVVSVAIIVGQINVKNRLINLNHAVFDFFGKISFGIYVYHPLIIFLLSKFIKNLSLNKAFKIVFVYTIVLGFTFLIAYLSYVFYEKKFIKLKNKFATIKSKSSRF